MTDEWDEPTLVDLVARLPMRDMVEADRMEGADGEDGTAEIAA